MTLLFPVNGGLCFLILPYICSRIRVLPPLDIKLYQLLLSISVAVLDPFPVGMHIQMIDAIDYNIPIVSDNVTYIYIY